MPFWSVPKADIKIIQTFDDKFAKLEELTQTASDGTTRIKTIVENLRTFSRLDNAEESQVHISELIKSTIQLTKTQYHTITMETQLNYDPLLTCSASKLNQVFMNIIVNACQTVEDKIKQTSESNNNVLALQASENPKFKGKVTISSEQRNNELVIHIKDNGCGIDETTQTKIFDPFFTTKEVGKGTGLGLAISFGIIKEHGGTLEVTSVVGEGTTFSICLPV